MVAREFEARGSQVVARRERTPFGEVDLVLVSSGGALQIVEVKSVGNLDFIETRLSARQRKRLHNVVSFFLQSHSEVELYLAFVDGQNKVQVFDEI